jgi:hypothetical protein
MCHIKKLLSGKKQQTVTLHMSTVCHLNTPAVHKHYNSTKHSCTTEHAWVLPKCIIMNSLRLSWNCGWWLELDWRCFFWKFLWRNVLLQTSQRYGRSPVCASWCDFRCFSCLNVLLHTSQQYGHSPECTRWCIFRLCVWLNVLLHTSQRYWHSPACTRRCIFMLCVWLNAHHSNMDIPQHVVTDVSSRYMFD